MSLVQRKSIRPAKEYIEGILRGDRLLLSRAITLIESNKPEHQDLAQEIVRACLPSSLIPHPSSLRIAVTGSPGVGKSTFIETFGTFLTAGGRKVAVLAIDPTSQQTKGSILGDKTRMNRLSTDPNAFIRPSPAGDSLGGVAQKTREAMLLCEAAGFDTILIETVGVGQSEVAVHEMTDFFLLLLQPGAGDELQGIKRGIMEMADLVAVNKSDGERMAMALEAKREFGRSLHLFPEKASGWVPKVVNCSALNGEGVNEIWQQILDFQELTSNNGWLTEHRRQQSKRWLHERIWQDLKNLFYQNPAVRKALEQLETAVMEGAQTPDAAARQIVGIFFQKNKAG